MPARGYFGFATYGGENITVENVSPVSLDPVSFLKAKFPGVYNDLLAQQWVIRAGDNDELKDVKPGGAVHCVDGRQYTDACLLYTSPSPRDRTRSRMPSSA